MKLIRGFALAALCLFLTTGGVVSADVDFGVSIGDDGIKGFYLAIGDHFGAPEKEVVAVRTKNIPDDHIPVMYFIARKADVSPQAVLKLRLGGKSWMDIALHFGVTAEAFYVHFDKDPGPPYGKAWGHFKKRKREHWGEIRLGDADIVNFVNLGFFVNYYGHPASEVVQWRAGGHGFVDIDKKVKAKKRAAKKHSQANKPGKGNKPNKDKDKKKKK